jgi:hypothetical protein
VRFHPTRGTAPDLYIRPAGAGDVVMYYTIAAHF